MCFNFKILTGKLRKHLLKLLLFVFHGVGTNNPQ